MTTSHRRDEILLALTRKVPLMSLAILAEFCWRQCESPLRLARRWTRRYEALGLIVRYVLLAAEPPAVAGPLLRWQPGDPPPNIYKLVYASESRSVQSPRPTQIIAATDRAIALYGGVAGKPKLSTINHDLLVSLVYTQVDEPTRNVWVGEALFAPNRKDRFGRQLKTPDVELRFQSGLRLLEVLGRYSARHIESFHDYAASEQIPYELW